MGPQWMLHPTPPDALTRPLREQLGLHPLVADILVRRGVDSPEAARRFLQPGLEQLHDPFLLKHMPRAVEAIVRALRDGRHIVISGDYDVDGITATALLYRFMQDAGAPRVSRFIPNRFAHGYGLTPKTVDALLALQPELVVTVDNGITAIDEVARLQAAGVETVITDHHLPSGRGVPAGVVVNPRQPGCPYPFKGISGVGVAFKLIMALRKVLRDDGWWTDARPEPNLKAFLDLVAVGTVADVVPLQDENRVFVQHGLDVMRQGAARLGLSTLARVANVKQMNARAIGFQIAPRINAAGRMTEGALGVDLLLAQDITQAEALARQLDEENNRRREVGQEMLDAAQAAIAAEGLDAAPALVVASPQFHEGIIGIVAARLVELYHKPAVVLAENGTAYKGSARSVDGINVTQAITACADLLLAFGGHAGAGGCTLPKEALAEFRERFVRACAEQAGTAGSPRLLLDGRLRPAQVDGQLVEQILRLEPFGHLNAEPSFLLEAADLPGEPRPLGQRHLKWQLGNDLDVVAWGLAGDYRPGVGCRVRMEFNEFRGRRKVQLVVQEQAPG